MRRIAVLDAPSNLGLRPPTATSVPGCAKAPGALRDQGLLTKLGARDAGCLTPPRYDPGDWRPGDGVAHAAEIAAYSRALADRIGAIIDGGEFPVVLGGDCSILIGAGIAMHRLGDAVGGRIGLVFVDGHSDFRHPGNASYVGAAAGEDLALVTGRGQADLAAIESRRPYFRDIDVVVLGIRAQDEYRLDLQAAGIVTRPVPALRAEGAARSAQWARDQLVDCAGYWVHVDVDVLDPAVMPAVDAPDPGGIAFPELELLLTGLVESPHCLGVEITVFDPDYDPDGRYASEITSAVVGGLSPVRTTAPRPDLAAARRDFDKPATRRSPAALLRPADPAPPGPDSDVVAARGAGPDTDMVAAQASGAVVSGSTASDVISGPADRIGSDSGVPVPAAGPDSALPAPAAAAMPTSVPAPAAMSTSAATSAAMSTPAATSAVISAAAASETVPDVEIHATETDAGTALGRPSITAISIEIQSSGSPGLPDSIADSEPEAAAAGLDDGTESVVAGLDDGTESVVPDLEPDTESSDAVSEPISVSDRGVVSDVSGVSGADGADDRGVVSGVSGVDGADDRGVVSDVSGADGAVALSSDGGAADAGTDAVIADDRGGEAAETDSGADRDTEDPEPAATVDSVDRRTALSVSAWITAVPVRDESADRGHSRSDAEFVLAAALATADLPDSADRDETDRAAARQSTAQPDESYLANGTGDDLADGIGNRASGAGISDGGISDVPDDRDLVVLKLSDAVVPVDRDRGEGVSDLAEAGIADSADAGTVSVAASGTAEDTGTGVTEVGTVEDAAFGTQGVDQGAGLPGGAGQRLADDHHVGGRGLVEGLHFQPVDDPAAEAGDVATEQAGSDAPDGTDLDGTDLDGTDLDGTDLDGTDLNEADPEALADADGIDPEAVADADAVGSDVGVEETDPVAEPDEEPRPDRTRTESQRGEVRLLSRPLGSAPLLDSEPLPATRPGMLRPRPPADGGFAPPAAGRGSVTGFPPGVA